MDGSQKQMWTMDRLFGLWPTARAFARSIGRPYTTVHAWKRRGKIAEENWDEIIAAAANDHGRHLTVTDLRAINRQARHLERLR